MGRPRQVHRRCSRLTHRPQKIKPPLCQQWGSFFRHRRRFIPSSIKPDTLGRDLSRFRPIPFWRRLRFKGPLASDLAKARLNRRWSVFHKEPPSSRWHQRSPTSRPSGFRRFPDPVSTGSLDRRPEGSSGRTQPIFLRILALMPTCGADIERPLCRPVNG